MIKWKETDVFNPTLIRDNTNSKLQEIIKEQLVLPRFKCHSQMVERAVKEVTEAAKKSLVGKDKMVRTIKTAMKHRLKFPKQASKKISIFNKYKHKLKSLLDIAMDK